MRQLPVFGKILPDQSIDMFVELPFPGVISEKVKGSRGGNPDP
jgi:hypothetical protein